MKGRQTKRVTMTAEQQAQARVEAHLRAQADYEAKNRRMLEAKRKAEDNIHSKYVRLQADLLLQQARERKARMLIRG